jgi:hypothetical protein
MPCGHLFMLKTACPLDHPDPASQVNQAPVRMRTQNSVNDFFYNYTHACTYLRMVPLITASCPGLINTRPSLAR